jgi:hypothetical protein
MQSSARAALVVIQMLEVNARRALPFPAYRKSLARYNPGRYNKSLDASGISGLVIDNLSVTWLSPAASTQPFDGFVYSMRKLLPTITVLLVASTLGFSQSTPSCDANNDPRIDKNQPGVFLTFERLGKAVNPLDTRLMEPSKTSNSKQKGSDVWLRLHNNSCWPIQLLTFSMYLPKERKPNEKLIDYIRRGATLDNNAEISLDYDVQEKDGRRLFSPFDSFSISRIPPGVSVIFSVAREHLSNDRRIFVDFNYIWEVDEHGATRNNEPDHRLEYTSYQLQRDLKN